MRDFYKFLIVGASGKGKTFASRTLDRKKTGFINAEDKPLPFINDFDNHVRVTSTASAKAALAKYAQDPNIDVIVLDSLSAYVEFLLAEARKTKKGFDIWNLYNEEIGNLLRFIKSIQKEVIVTAHYEMLNIEGEPEKRVKVKGKEWEGLVEKEFTVVLYAEKEKDDKGVVSGYLNLNLDASSAKCPPFIYGEGVNKIDNDYGYMIEKLREALGA